MRLIQVQSIACAQVIKMSMDRCYL